MEKDFVTYNEALALKELGFDEPCLASYETAFGKGIDFELGYIINGPKNYVLAPLYQQAFRWFREKHGYFSSPMQSTKPSGIEYDWLITKDIDESRIFVKTVGYFTTYEEAELECLKKLIKIVNEIEK